MGCKLLYVKNYNEWYHSTHIRQTMGDILLAIFTIFLVVSARDVDHQCKIKNSLSVFPKNLNIFMTNLIVIGATIWP